MLMQPEPRLGEDREQRGDRHDLRHDPRIAELGTQHDDRCRKPAEEHQFAAASPEQDDYAGLPCLPLNLLQPGKKTLIAGLG